MSDRGSIFTKGTDDRKSVLFLFSPCTPYKGAWYHIRRHKDNKEER